MKNFDAELEIIQFNVNDIITTSGPDDNKDDGFGGLFDDDPSV